MINVTKPYMPPKKEFLKRVCNILDRGILTNQGPEVAELESNLKAYLGVDYIHYVTNGTIALQIALKALELDEGEVLTTPFSYVATCSAILWQRLTPIFVDIEPNNFTIDVNVLESKITKNTVAIMPVHVFGYACDVKKIEQIASKYNLKVIYDAAHTFGSKLNGKSLCSYGDVSTLSFHATKLFHTIEGGACVVNSRILSDKINLIKKFGHNGDEHYLLGLNGKQDEINASMGNVILPRVHEIIHERKIISEIYDNEIDSCLYRPKVQKGLEYNYAYYPVLFPNEEILLNVKEFLGNKGIHIRRYFYPSLNKLPYIEYNCSNCKISQDISSRIACLPLFNGLNVENVKYISKSINFCLKKWR